MTSSSIGESRGDFAGDVPVPSLYAFSAERLEVGIRSKPRWNRELGKVVAAKTEIERAHLGDSDRVRNRFRYVLKDAGHLLRTFEEELITFGLQALGIVQRGVCLDTDQNILRRRVLLLAVVHVVRGDEGQALSPGQRNEIAIDANLVRQPVVLKFDEESIGAEDIGELAGIVASGIRPAVQEIVGYRTAQTGRRRDQPFPVLRKHLQIDTRPIVVALELGQGGKLQQVAVSRLVLGEQQQVIRLALLGPGAALGQVGLDPDDRVKASGRRGAVPLHRAIHDAMVRYRNVVDAQFLGPGSVLGGTTHPVEQ